MPAQRPVFLNVTHFTGKLSINRSFHLSFRRDTQLDIDFLGFVAYYTAGVLTKEQTLEQLKIKKLYNQLVLTTKKALSYLRFVGTVPEEEF